MNLLRLPNPEVANVLALNTLIIQQKCYGNVVQDINGRIMQLILKVIDGAQNVIKIRDSIWLYGSAKNRRNNQ